MIRPPAFLLQQQVALKTARRVAVARGASFASFLPATDKIRAKVRAVRPGHDGGRGLQLHWLRSVNQ